MNPGICALSLEVGYLAPILTGQPPAKGWSKGRVQQPDIETENDHAAGSGCPGRERIIHEGTHDIAAARKHHQRNDRHRQHETEHHLANDKGLRGIEAQQDDQHSGDHRHKTP